jgi:2-polyprenyl-6-hydroxyphenyl methylase/3-demethylubiquinone-9 3-methyltransferase
MTEKTAKTSIDETELNKFNKTHAEWWDEFGEFKILHQITPLRADYIIQKAIKHFGINPNGKTPLAGLSLLDVGCGGGLISAPMLRSGATVTGIDANSYNIKAAKEHATKYKLKIDFLNETAEEHLKLNNKYDIVICLEVIEHVASPEEFIKTLTNLIKPGGMMIFSTINRTIKSYGLAIIMAEYVLGWVPRGTHDYTKFIKPSELKRMLSGSGKDIKELRGMSFNVLSKNWQLEDDIDVNYFAYIA